MIKFAAKRFSQFCTVVFCLLPILSFADSGTFKMTAVLTHSYQTIDSPDTTYTGGWVEGYSAVSESTGELFEKGQVYLCRCIVYSHGMKDDLELTAPCEWTDADGDRLITMSSRNESGVSEGQSGDGFLKFLHGGGKFEGVEGSCNYSISYLPDSTAVSALNCEWSRE